VKIVLEEETRREFFDAATQDVEGFRDLQRHLRQRRVVTNMGVQEILLQHNGETMFLIRSSAQAKREDRLDITGNDDRCTSPPMVLCGMLKKDQKYLAGERRSTCTRLAGIGSSNSSLKKRATGLNVEQKSRQTPESKKSQWISTRVNSVTEAFIKRPAKHDCRSSLPSQAYSSQENLSSARMSGDLRESPRSLRTIQTTSTSDGTY
jgi:hypothetical protein